MRKQVNLLAEFLGAAKDLTNEYAELAGITEDEKNQIGQALMARPDRKATAQLLSAKGLSTRVIAKITGWHHTTIAEDLKALRPVGNPTESAGNPTNDTEAEPPEVVDEESTVGANAPPTIPARVSSAAMALRSSPICFNPRG
jgi:hypothetical protein